MNKDRNNNWNDDKDPFTEWEKFIVRATAFLIFIIGIIIILIALLKHAADLIEHIVQ